jgi:hypothetical protein
MSDSRAAVNNDHQHITPPSSFVDNPLTPPQTDEKPFAQAHRIIALFEAVWAGRHTNQGPWREFVLAPGEYDELVRLLGRNEELLGYVKNKIRYVYPTGLNIVAVSGVDEFAVRSRRAGAKTSDEQV